MKSICVGIVALFMATALADAQTRIPIEARSHVTVLVDLSGTWLNERSKPIDKRELRTVASTIAALVTRVKPPVEIRYFEIGDGSLSRPPICEARFAPNIFRTSENAMEFADLAKLVAFFSDDCTQFILMHKPQPYTDITGALNTVARISSTDTLGYNAVMILSDFQEERRPKQVGGVGSLKGIHTLLLYRVLEADRFNIGPLDARIKHWESIVRSAGASETAIDDVALEPAQLTRLLEK